MSIEPTAAPTPHALPLAPEALDPDTRRAQVAYDAAADHYTLPALGFWRRYGRRTIERLDLRPGMQVLDVACGTGASALPAAERVGPTGHVLALDLADNLLAVGRAEAARRGYEQIAFEQADMTATGLPDAAFDVVVSVFGIFFAADMAALAADLWRMVRPGGRLAVTTWGPDLWEPATGIWRAAVNAERSGLIGDFHPWDRITTPSAVAALLLDAGIPPSAIDVEAEDETWPIATPDDWWSIVLGTGYRWTMDQLSAEQADRVRAACDTAIYRDRVTEVATNVIYAVATKPVSPAPLLL
jgi:ubiquinone/menaquinone biosynthesis C-methylase UbiE